jgi:hypothetical protein
MRSSHQGRYVDERAQWNALAGVQMLDKVIF